MFSRAFQLLAALGLFCGLNVSAGVLYVDLNSTNPISPFTAWATAATNIQDAVDAASPGDQVLVTNGVYQTGGRYFGTNSLWNRVLVSQPISVQSVNGPAVTTIEGLAPANSTDGSGRCVYLSDGATLAGFTVENGQTLGFGAAGPDPVNLGSGGGIWCVSTNCLVSDCVVQSNLATYSGGGAYQGTFTNCIFNTNAATFGLGGGGGANGAVLYNCMLTGNQAASYGGGAYACSLTNCTLVFNSAPAGGGAYGGTLVGCNISSNSASTGGGTASANLTNCLIAANHASAGGGAYGGTIVRCQIVSNSAATGGGVNLATLWNCLVANNSALNSGGAANVTMTNCTIAANIATNLAGGAGSSRLTNCIIFSNTAPTSANYTVGPNAALAFCCTTPLPASGLGNFTNDPSFVNVAGGNFRLQTNSPCINSGTNSYAPGAVDLDGRPRIVGGTVDMGCYEFQGPGLGEFIAWLQQYGFPTDGSADFLDPDHDGMNNWQEWRAGTDPTNPLSVLQMLSPTYNGTNLIITWQSVTNEFYYLLRATNLSAQPAFQPLATNLVGHAGTTSYTDTNATGPGPFFYRVGVQ